MNFSNAFLTLLQQQSTEKPTLFPFPLSMHFILVIFGTVFLAYRFSVQKRPSQLILASAMIISLAIWLSESKVLYYSIGVIELVLLIASFVTSLIFKAPEYDEAAVNEESDEEAVEEEEAEAEASDTAEDEEEEEAAVETEEG